MSLTLKVERPVLRPGRTARRLLLAALVLALAGAGLAALGLVTGSLIGSAAVAPKNPFGTGLREAAPAGTGLGVWILAVQSEFYRGLTGSLATIRRGEGALWGLIAIGFAYGVFHAAGPGHGKGVIAGYLLATRRTLVRGLGLSLAAALVQAAAAILLVGVMAALLRASSHSINVAASFIEIASFAALLLVGLALLWRKTAALVPSRLAGAVAHGHSAHRDGHGEHAHTQHSAHHHHHDGACCGHTHMPAPAEVDRAASLRESAAIVFAAGIRPCSGAIILLVFALSQGLFAVGVLATLAMALGTALTTGALAALAVLAKGAAVRLAGGEGQGGARLVAWLEVGAAGFVAALGAALVLGSWTGTGPS